MDDVDRMNAARLLIDTCNKECERCIFYQRSGAWYGRKVCTISIPESWGMNYAEKDY